MPERHRTVIESADFERDRVGISSDVRLLDEALRGITTVLSRYPEAGHRTAAPGIWLIYTRPLLGMPVYAIYYEFDEDTVWMRGIKMAS